MGKKDRKEAIKAKLEQQKQSDKKLNKLLYTPKRKLKIPKSEGGWSLQDAQQ